MHPLYLVNEGTVAVAMMSVALFIAFAMVIGLGAYVIYCDRLNRAEEGHLAHAEADTAEESPAAASGAPAATPPSGH